MSIFDSMELRWLLEHPAQPESKRLQYRVGGELFGAWKDVPLVFAPPKESQAEARDRRGSEPSDGERVANSSTPQGPRAHDKTI